MKRVTWAVRPAGLFGWRVTRECRDAVREEWHAFKFLAVRAARAYCKQEWEEWHIPSELLIANRKGRYTDAGSTYGYDPRESEG
jgi:hypothetical protein